MTTEERERATSPEIDDDVARLVRLADTSGPIAPVDEVRLARVRTAVHDAWRDEHVARTRRRRLWVAVPLVAAVSVVIAFAIWGPIRTPASVRTPAPVLVAHVDQITGQVAGAPAPFTAGGAVMSGSTVATSNGTLAMTFSSGVHLRLDASSSVRVETATDIALERGAVYVDSADAHPTQPGASPISIRTPPGLVRDIGTRFEVRLVGAGIRIRVRDGQVRLTDANGAEARADAGEGLFSRPDGSINRRPIAVTGSEWAWAERAAPLFSAEGNTLGELLDWVSREGAWTVTFADRKFSEVARATVVHGRSDQLKGFTTAEVLDTILPTCGFRYRIDGHRVVIGLETSKGASR